MEEQHAAVVEVNAGPGLRMHLDPSAGKPRPVGEAIVGMLFPEGENGRIPIVAVTGGAGRGAVARLTAHLLRQAGHVTGMACAEGLYLGGRRIVRRDGSGPDGHRDVLINPSVSAAILETSPAGIARAGLGFDQCDVAVVTGISNDDPLSPSEPEAHRAQVRLNLVVVGSLSSEGVAVLNADDPLVRDMAPRCRGKVLYYSARECGGSRNSPWSAGQSILSLKKNEVVLLKGDSETAILSLNHSMLTHEGNALLNKEHVLAAIGAGLSLGISPDVIREGLQTFRGDDQ
jgi:cyanophycin synthetase